MMYFLLQYV